MATPREIVWKTLQFQKPERVPFHKGALPWALERYPDFWAALDQKYPNDIINVSGFWKKEAETNGSVFIPGKYTDAWGVEFVNIAQGIQGEVRKPIVSDEGFEDTSRVHIPYEWLTVDIDRVNRFCHETDKFVRAGNTIRPFEQIQFIRGTEQLMVDIALKTEGFVKFLNKMTEFYIELAEIWAKTDIDCMMLMDDWGSQRALLINPADWRKLFKPIYAEVCKIARRRGKMVYMHSDGYILDIYGDLIEIGVNGLNSQIFCMGAGNLKKYAGKITFWGEIDRQNLLPNAVPEQITKEVHKIKETLWADGGCIAQCEFGPGAKPENVAAVYDAWASYRF